MACLFEGSSFSAAKAFEKVAMHSLSPNLFVALTENTIFIQVLRSTGEVANKCDHIDGLQCIRQQM